MSKNDKYTQLINELEAAYGQITLEKKIISSGALQVTASTTSGRYIQHVSLKLIPTDVLDNMPISADYRSNNPPCSVCGEPGTELHHWAPKYLFEDADSWPTSYLCKKHHDEWHNRIKGDGNKKIT